MQVAEPLLSVKTKIGVAFPGVGPGASAARAAWTFSIAGRANTCNIGKHTDEEDILADCLCYLRHRI